jgi:hypothetical protein
MRQLVACVLAVSVIAPLQAAKKKTPLPIDPKYTAIGNVAVLPVVDARAGKKTGINLEKLREHIVKLLDHKHYPASAAAPGPQTEIAIEDVETPTTEFIRKLGPSAERWVLVVFLNDSSSKITFGSTGNAQVSAFLFDKEAAQLVWSGKGVGQAGQGGLIGMPLKSMMKGEALDAALDNLFASLPERPKPGK